MVKRLSWADTLTAIRNAPSEQDAHVAFVRACGRAFAGTGFGPVRFRSEAAVDGSLHQTITLELTVSSLLAELPLSAMVPHPAGVRDPRFHLRGLHPKRGRNARSLHKKHRGLV